MLQIYNENRSASCAVCDNSPNSAANTICFDGTVLADAHLFGQFGTKSDLVKTLHPIEVIFLVLEMDCFIFYETKQICVQAFFDLYFNEFGKEGLDLFLVYFHFLKKAWRVSIDRRGFQAQIHSYFISQNL